MVEMIKEMKVALEDYSGNVDFAIYTHKGDTLKVLLYEGSYVVEVNFSYLENCFEVSTKQDFTHYGNESAINEMVEYIEEFNEEFNEAKSSNVEKIIPGMFKVEGRGFYVSGPWTFVEGKPELGLKEFDTKKLIETIEWIGICIRKLDKAFYWWEPETELDKERKKIHDDYLFYKRIAEESVRNMGGWML